MNEHRKVQGMDITGKGPLALAMRVVIAKLVSMAGYGKAAEIAGIGQRTLNKWTAKMGRTPRERISVNPEDLRQLQEFLRPEIEYFEPTSCTLENVVSLEMLPEIEQRINAAIEFMLRDRPQQAIDTLLNHSNWTPPAVQSETWKVARLDDQFDEEAWIRQKRLTLMQQMVRAGYSLSEVKKEYSATCREVMQALGADREFMKKLREEMRRVRRKK